MPRPARPSDTAGDPPLLTVSGIQAVAAALRHRRLLHLFIDRKNPRTLALQKAALQQALEVHETTHRTLTERTEGDPHHQGIVALIRPPTTDLATLQRSDKDLLALDGITDPRNLGALMRAAHAFDFAAVIAPKRRTAPLSPAAVRASAGAVAALPLLRVTNLARTLRALQSSDTAIIGIDERGETDWSTDPPPRPSCWVLGDEGLGARRLTLEQCDRLLRLPTISGEGGCLNATVAFAVSAALATAYRTARPAPDRKRTATEI